MGYKILPSLLLWMHLLFLFYSSSPPPPSAFCPGPFCKRLPYNLFCVTVPQHVFVTLSILPSLTQPREAPLVFENTFLHGPYSPALEYPDAQ